MHNEDTDTDEAISSFTPPRKGLKIDYSSLSKAQKVCLMDEMLRTGLPVREGYLADLLRVCRRTIQRYAGELRAIGRLVLEEGPKSDPYLRYAMRPPSPAVFDPDYYERWYDRVPLEDRESRLYNIEADKAEAEERAK